MTPPKNAPQAAVVVAVLNEAENIEAVTAEITAAFSALDDYEIVYVDDGSTDETAALIEKMAAKDRHIRLIRHDKRSAKSAGLKTGIRAARAPWIATMDGDGQNDPKDLVDMLRLAWAADGTPPLVAGIRQRRNDPVSKLVATKIANNLRRAVLHDACPDTGCGMKVFQREDFLLLPIFEGMHRFIPALMQSYGVPLINHPVSHRPRTLGVSKYNNWNRGWVGFFDLIGVVWLKSRIKHPRVTETTPVATVKTSAAKASPASAKAAPAKKPAAGKSAAKKPAPKKTK